MCGIVGFFASQDRISDLASALPAMTDALRHRGPDDRGEWADPKTGIGLGHRRLAIIDLSPLGHQPMVSASGRYHIVFNGEIYNFRELRDRLEAIDHRFVGGSDTEVILAAVEAWGLLPSIAQFVGIFAFGLWDAVERKLHLVRDHLGVKPLYYAFDGQQLTFASELKALTIAPRFDGAIDRTSLALFLKYGYIPGSRTIFANARKLEPATVLTIDSSRLRTQSLSFDRYWSPPIRSRERDAEDDSSLVAELDELVRTAVKAQLVSDVPLGAFLSGGVDSSTVVAAMQAQSTTPVKTFSIGFTESSFNEAIFARDVANHLGTEHTELYLTPREAQEVIPLLPNMFDEPFADVSQIPTYLVSRLARRHVTVSLSGDGGDELFFGYTKYQYALRWHRRLQLLPRILRRSVAAPLRGITRSGFRQGLLRSKTEMLVEMLSRESDGALFDYFASWKYPERVMRGPSGVMPGLVADEDTVGVTEFAQLMSYTDIKSYLAEDVLTKLDRSSMAVGLEARVPLLDHRLVEFAMQLPLHFKLRNGVSKWALKQVLYKYVPREIVDRPKMGFGVPIGDWLKGPLRAWAEDLFDENRLRSEGYFDGNAVRAVWREHLDGRFDWQFPLWNLLTFQAWLRACRA